jgi:hypothetical protein
MNLRSIRFVALMLAALGPTMGAAHTLELIVRLTGFIPLLLSVLVETPPSRAPDR